MEPTDNHGAYLEDINNITNNIIPGADYETRSVGIMATEYQPVLQPTITYEYDYASESRIEDLRTMNLDHTNTFTLVNPETLNGKIICEPKDNEIQIVDSNGKIIRINIVVDDTLNPIGLNIDGVRWQGKEITENQRGNLDDSSVQYGTNPDALQQLI